MISQGSIFLVYFSVKILKIPYQETSPSRWLKLGKRRKDHLHFLGFFRLKRKENTGCKMATKAETGEKVFRKCPVK